MACRRAVSILIVVAISRDPNDALDGVDMLQGALATSRSFLFFFELFGFEKKTTTHLLAVMLTSFCQYSICNVSCFGSWFNDIR